jgi:predicted membrane protein
VAVILVVYLIGRFTSGGGVEEIGGVLIAYEHINFIMVMTNLVFAMMTIAFLVSDTANRIIFWGINAGVVGFAIGLMSESAVLKRIFTPILGLTLLYGIWTYLTAKAVEPVDAVSG